MKELLNKLIEKGWKPRGKNYGVVDFLGTLVFVDLNDGRLQSKNALDLRKLTSKESLLRQFVCENDMVEEQKEEKLIEIYDNLRGRTEVVYDDGDYEYRLIESALKDESELEEFLLENIKVE